MKGVKCLECGTNTVVILEEKKVNVHSRKTNVIMGCTICGKKEVF